MAKPLLTDALWAEIEPLLPKHEPSPLGGRPRVPDRKCLLGVLFVLKTGCPWEYLPAKEIGSGSVMTCWRRLRDWNEAGVWEAVWQKALDRLGKLRRVDWSQVVGDSCSVRAVFGGRAPARTRRTAANPARNAIS